MNLEIKYPCDFLYTCSRFFVQHVHVVGKWLALWKYFKRATEVRTSLTSPTGSLYRATFSCRAATKEIQRVIDIINDGTLYGTYEGPYTLKNKAGVPVWTNWCAVCTPICPNWRTLHTNLSKLAHHWCAVHTLFFRVYVSVRILCKERAHAN